MSKHSLVEFHVECRSRANHVSQPATRSLAGNWKHLIYTLAEIRCQFTTAHTCGQICSSKPTRETSYSVGLHRIGRTSHVTGQR